MNRRPASIAARIDELLLDQAINGLDKKQNEELDNLLDTGALDDNPFMETAALVQLGLASMDKANSTDRMPANLRQRLLRDAPGARHPVNPSDK